MLKNQLVILVFFLLSILIFSHNSSSQAAPDSFLYEVDFNDITIDGVYNSEEYPILQDILTTGSNKFAELAWGHNSTHLATYIKILGTGWIGLGLGEVGTTMDTANIIMASVDSGVVIAEDMSAIDQEIPTQDVDDFMDPNFLAGIESNGETTLEMIVPLSSGDTAGDDQDWSVLNTYGFFLAYHISNDDFTVQHTAHSVSLVVEILDEPFDNTIELDLFLDVDYDETNQTITLMTMVYEENTTDPVANLTIDFFRKAQFGQVYINSSDTDNSGMAVLKLTADISGNITFTASYAGSENIVADQDTMHALVSGEVHGLIEEENEFNDLRGDFGEEHLMRAVLVYSTALIIVLVLYNYLAVVRDVIKIKLAGNKKEIKEEKE